MQFFILFPKRLTETYRKRDSLRRRMVYALATTSVKVQRLLILFRHDWLLYPMFGLETLPLYGVVPFTMLRT